MRSQIKRPLGNMLANPSGGCSGVGEWSRPAAGVKTEGCLDDPLATIIAMAFVSKFDQDRDQLSVVKQHQRVAVGAVRSDPYFIG